MAKPMTPDDAKIVADLRHRAKLCAKKVHDDHSRAVNAGVNVWTERTYKQQYAKLQKFTAMIAVILAKYR
jgi:hypothetical protein